VTVTDEQITRTITWHTWRVPEGMKGTLRARLLNDAAACPVAMQATEFTVPRD